ncbi:MAG: protein kinase [Acidobacteriia bacterium]|nr:protein kinase [Terriglobia bacterium]
MNPEQWERIKEIFASALEQDPSRRAEFLRQACRGDDSVRAELESLLSTYDSVGATGKALRAAPGDEDLAGQKIGPYRVLRQIGVGGMGAVYLAVRADEAYSKRVAIKLVQTGVDTQEIARRFRHERQILATLDHPNIARLVDGGTTERGVPYFVMDYVEGTRIDDYCDRHKLSIEERISLCREVCSAVQYVHQNLVVHRDLKPGNILVTAEGVPKLLDFGIAKLLKPELFTSLADATMVEFRLMTPGYASPEQVRGEPVTTASDVYSLGVILYELLTSQRPYRLKTDAPGEVLRAVCDQEPERPSVAVIRMAENEAGKDSRPEVLAEKRATVPEKLQRQLSGDLDTIVLKALRKEPQRRYASVERFSDDLHRYLTGLPVSAQRDTWSYRADKFVRRNKVGVAAATLLAVSLIGGVLATTWQARVARAERANAQQQFNDVRKLTTSFLFEFHNAIQDLPGSTPARRLLVQRAQEYLSKLAQRAQNDRALQRELAEAYLKVGDVQGNPYVPNLGDTEGASQSYTKALEISHALVSANAKDSEAQGYLGRSYKSLGEVLPLLGKPSEAAVDLRRATEVFEALVAARPVDDALRTELASSYQVLGDVQGHSGIQNLGDRAAAFESYSKGQSIYEALASKDPSNKAARRGVAVLRLRIGDLLAAKDDLPGSMSNYRSALDILEQLAAADPTNADARRLLALGYKKIGGAQEVGGNSSEALKYYRKAGLINESLVNADPTNAQASMNYMVTLRYIGDLLYKTGGRAGALAEYEKILGILEKLSAAEPDNVMVRGRFAEMLIGTAGLLIEDKRLADARALTTRGLAVTRELASRADATPDDLAQYATNFLTCEPKDLRDPVAALRYAKESVEKSGGTDPDDLDILAQAYFQNGDATQAVAAEEKALALLPPVAGNEVAFPARHRIETQLAKFKAALTHR